MTKNIRFVVSSAGDRAALTASASLMPVDNLKKTAKESVWRTDTQLSTVYGTFTEPEPINCLVLANTNMSDSAYVRAVFTLQGVVVYDTGSVPYGTLVPAGVWTAGIDPWLAMYDNRMPPPIAKFWFDDVFYADGFEVTIDDPALPDGYLEVGRLFCGEYISPEINFSYGAQLAFIDSSKHRYTQGGVSTQRGTIRREFQFDLKSLGEEDRRRLELEFALAGKWADIFLCAYPEEGGFKEVVHTFLGRRKEDFVHQHTGLETYQSKIIITEL